MNPEPVRQYTIRGMPHSLSRRGFLQATGAGAFASLGAPPVRPLPPSRRLPSQAVVAPGESLGGWFDRPMRWVQLTLVENDPGRFDPQFWLDYFRRLHADAATLSAGGIVAYYPTAVPLHHRSAWLGQSDPFGTLVAGCRALGMHVVARTDPHAVRDDVREAHPDWIAVTRAGTPLAALGQPRSLGDVRARSLQLRAHGSGPPRDRLDVQGGRHLREPLGAAGRRLLLRALRAELQECHRRGASPHDRQPRPAAPSVPRVEEGAADRALEAVGRDGARRSTPRRASFPTARRTSRRPASWRPFSSPTTRRAAASRRPGTTAGGRKNTGR